MENGSITCHEWAWDYYRHDRNITLQDVNDKLVIRFFGGIFLIPILIFIGLIGNGHVLFIYLIKSKSGKNYRIYVIFLAMLDVFNLGVSAPMVLYYLFHPVTFPYEIYCKIFRFIMYFANVASTCALIAIAIDRGHKTLAPLQRQWGTNEAKILCLASIFVATVLSWPTPFLYGVDKVPTGVKDMSGYRCLAEDINKSYMRIFLLGQMIFFCIVSISLVILYSLIGCKLHSYKMIRNQSTMSGRRRSSSNKMMQNQPSMLEGNRRSSSDSNKRVNRSTVTLVIVTLVYICSSLPHHILASMYFLVPNFDCKLTLPQAIAYYTFIFSCFVNNTLNPFIYGFRDKKFWWQVKKLYHFD